MIWPRIDGSNDLCGSLSDIGYSRLEIPSRREPRMDAYNNPLNPGAGVSPPEPAGRSDVL